MGVTVQEAGDADAYRLIVVASEAFARNEKFFDLLYPQHWTEKGRQAAAARLVKSKHSDPTVKLVKAVDDESGLIVGFAKWLFFVNTIPDTSKPLDSSPELQSEEDFEFLNKLVPQFLSTRMAELHRTEGNLASLDLLTIHPDFQRRGVGDALVKWGLRKADELKLEAVVESSVFGKGLYLKNGFNFVKDVRFDIPEKFKDRPAVPGMAWMTKPKSSA